MNKMLRFLKNIKNACLLFSNLKELVLFRLAPGRVDSPKAKLRSGEVFALDPACPDAGRATLQEIWTEKVYPIPNGRDAKMIIDVGANIGAFSVYAAARCPEARVIAYEPDPNAFALLEKNIDENDSSGRITAVPRAVLTDAGQINFFQNLESSTRSTTQGSYWASERKKPIPVQSESLRTVFQTHAIEFCDVLKLDCEGAEYRILEEVAPNLLRRIQKIVMEYHKDPDCSQELSSTAHKLYRNGFRIKVMPHPEDKSLGLLWAVKNGASQ